MLPKFLPPHLMAVLPTCSMIPAPYRQQKLFRQSRLACQRPCAVRCSQFPPPPPKPRRTQCRSAPAWNPQNVPNPQVLPSPEFSAEQAVRVQLDALKNNDAPWPNHGVQTMYEFGDDIGGLDPSWYFGFRKDLYHLDHFAGQFLNQLGALVGWSEYSIEGVAEGGQEEDADAVVLARVVDSNGVLVRVEFRLKRRQFGSKKGAFMTRMVRKVA